MMKDTKKYRRSYFPLIFFAGVIFASSVTVFSIPAELCESVDDSVMVGTETWRVWTELIGSTREILFDRVIGEYVTGPEIVNIANSVNDMDSSINTCLECINESEQVWAVWERIDPAGPEKPFSDTDIIMGTRSIGGAWGSEAYPHYNNDYDDFNPDVYGDSEGHVWIAWVAYFENVEYQIRYSYYNGLDITDDSCWWVNRLVDGGGVDSTSEPEIFEVDGQVWVGWKDIYTQYHEALLPRPDKIASW